MVAKSTLMGLGLGQLVSLFFALTGFTSYELAKKGVYAPFSQCFLHYLLFAFFYGGITIRRRQPLMARSYLCIILALVDVLEKLFVIKAYHHTSLTSIMLLDRFSSVCSMVLCFFFCITNFGFQELVSFAFCVAGFVAVVLSDVHSADGSSGINPLRGDLFIIVGATLKSVGNCIEGFFLEWDDCEEIMAFLGIYGAILSAFQIVFNERNQFKSIISSPETMFLIIGFSLAAFLIDSGFILILKIYNPMIGGSRMINMSLLTSNTWVVLIQIFVYHEKVNWIYYVCFAAVTLGYTLFYFSERYDDIINDEPDTKPATIDEKAIVSHSNNDGIV